MGFGLGFNNDSSYDPNFSASGSWSVSDTEQAILPQIPGVQTPISKANKKEKPDYRGAMQKLESHYGLSSQEVADLFNLTITEYQQNYKAYKPPLSPGVALRFKSVDQGEEPFRTFSSNRRPSSAQDSDFLNQVLFDFGSDVESRQKDSQADGENFPFWSQLLEGDSLKELEKETEICPTPATEISDMITITIPAPKAKDKWQYEHVMYVKSQVDSGKCSLENLSKLSFPEDMKKFSSATTLKHIKYCGVAHIQPNTELFPDNLVKYVYEKYLERVSIQDVLNILKDTNVPGGENYKKTHQRVSELYHYAQYRGPYIP